MSHDKPSAPFRAFDNFRWDDVNLLAYKEEGAAPFKAITRQTLFQADQGVTCSAAMWPALPHEAPRRLSPGSISVARMPACCSLSAEAAPMSPPPITTMDFISG